MLTSMEAMQSLCLATESYGLYIRFDPEIVGPPENRFEEIKKASNGRLDPIKESQVMIEGCGIILFATEEEVDEAYLDFVGDDGPTSRNRYDGPMKILAIACNDRGVLMRENT